MGLTVTTQPNGAQLPLDSLEQRFTWVGSNVSHIECDYQGSTYRQTFNYTTGRSITGVTIGSGGPFGTYVGYTLTGPGEDAVLTPVFEVASVALVGAGTGYTNGDILDIDVGTHSVVGQVQVTGVGGGGNITSITGHAAGTYTAIPPGSSQPFSVTGGTGTGATISAQWAIASMTVVDEGMGYTAGSGITFNTSGGSTPTGTLVLTGSDVTVLDSITGWELQS